MSKSIRSYRNSRRILFLLLLVIPSFLLPTKVFAYPGFKCTGEVKCADSVIISTSKESDFGPKCYKLLVEELQKLCASRGGLQRPFDWWDLFQAQQRKDEEESRGKQVVITTPNSYVEKNSQNLNDTQSSY